MSLQWKSDYEGIRTYTYGINVYKIFKPYKVIYGWFTTQGNLLVTATTTCQELTNTIAYSNYEY